MDWKRKTSTELRPRFEGANVGTWIGFKHVMYLAEEAALDHLRQNEVSPGLLLKQHNLGVEIVDTKLRLSKALEVDHVVRAEVETLSSEGPELLLSAKLLREEGGELEKVATGRMKLVLRTTSALFEETAPPPKPVAPIVCDRIQRQPDKEKDQRQPIALSDPMSKEACIEALHARYPNAFVWPWQVPYFYCHYTERMQHSGYVRLMEEVVDRFLRDRGTSIYTFLKERRWIPVVGASRVEVLKDLEMESPLYVCFNVEELLRGISWTARMECYAPVDGCLEMVATGRINHAYLLITGRGVESELVVLDGSAKRAIESGLER